MNYRGRIIRNIINSAMSLLFITASTSLCTTTVQAKDIPFLLFTKDTYLLSFNFPIGPGGEGAKGPEIRCNERKDLDLRSQITHLPVRDFPQYDPVISASAMCHGINNNTLNPMVEFTSFQGDLPFVYNRDGTPIQKWGVKAFCRFEATEFYYPPAQVILMCADGRRIRTSK